MRVRSIIQWTAFPGILVAALLTSLALSRAGYSDAFAVFSVTLGAALPILLLQLMFPFDEEWRGRPRDFGLDLLHMLSTGLAGDLWRAVSFGVAVTGSAWLSASLGMTLWPSEWPLLFQFALAMVIGDFGAYWVHRTCHTVPLFWRIHAMHHSSQRLYVFSATRNHPANVVFAYGSQVLPLIVLGVSNEVLILVSVFTAVHGMLQHANIDLKHGWLNHVFATADLHRWHHSAHRDEECTNYGSNLIIWDWVFGTRFLPEGRTRPERMGLGNFALPENWFTHLASPFILNRFATEAAVEEHVDALVADLGDLDDFTLEAERPAPAMERPRV
jgi:sterol desaturase/sphingolipid hydroxylase (fatty acid hydroxylase superfamily)